MEEAKNMADRQEIIKGLEWWVKHQEGNVLPLAYSAVVETLEALKDKPEIVLCKDCKKCDLPEEKPYENGYCSRCGYVKTDWFCADGDRRDSDD